jgi:hypothetical protein
MFPMPFAIRSAFWPATLQTLQSPLMRKAQIHWLPASAGTA